MATFVLVHGAYHGGWCWKKVTPLLRAAGHDVYTPTLTGVGERAHLLTPDIDLDTHITDIVNVLEYEDLREIVLVGHSYGGMVIAGVAERVPHRLSHLIYLDAVFPMDDDRSVKELQQRHNDPSVWQRYEAQIRESGDQWLIPAPTGVPLYGVTQEDDVRWLRERLTPHPAKTFLQRGAGDDATDRRLPRTFILCPNAPGKGTWFAVFGERIEGEGGQYHELAGGRHDVMVTMPKELSALLSTLTTAAAQIPGVSWLSRNEGEEKASVPPVTAPESAGMAGARVPRAHHRPISRAPARDRQKRRIAIAEDPASPRFLYAAPLGGMGGRGERGRVFYATLC